MNYNNNGNQLELRWISDQYGRNRRLQYRTKGNRIYWIDSKKDYEQEDVWTEWIDVEEISTIPVKK